MKAEISIDRESKKPVNPLIFGHFIEFMRDCIDDGMWAQLLKNRGFDIPGPDPRLPEHWRRTGCKDAYVLELDRGESISKGGASMKITCFNHYDGYVGIEQKGFPVAPADYEGYLWTKAERETPVTVRIYGGEGTAYLRETFTAGPRWQKQEFHFRADSASPAAALEISLSENGTVWVDGASLMPAGARGGVWKEVWEAVEELRPPVIRFPGGCFADCYHWEDGIGPRDARPVRENLHWGGWEDNSFGTDEYMDFCRSVGCEPMICVNFGSGTPQEAARWVEYCNGAADTPGGRLRAENGHPEPYRIKYWDIGNETFGDWEIGHLDAKGYAEKYLSFHRAMKEKGPSIVFLACGGDGDSRSQEWNRQIAEIIGENMDVLCLHMYAQKEIREPIHNRDIYYATVGSVKKYEEILRDSFRTIREHGSPRALTAVTEYNVGTITDTYREQTLEAAIFNAGMLNLFIRSSDILSLCNLSDLVNGWPGGCIVSRDGRAFGTATYHVMSMYSNSDVSHTLKAKICSPLYRTGRQVGNIEPLEEIPYLDAAACLSRNGRVVIFAVNRSCEEEMELWIRGCGPIRAAEITTVTSEKTSDMNTLHRQPIKPVTRRLDFKEGSVLLEKNSVNRITLILEPGGEPDGAK